ncbi:YheC/YheD family protein [Neobacillus sp. 179-C4.2 HS]|jgi:glutathione synthase/RimK-type ligase-like ATP-grasp enzyme|uniref:YheC/YheD family protein n=1 Tax=Neobacillus driksii TaxID=3035913 RepID=A0ABV4YW57_9BACI|nr:YheC/YheD family protein [Neobacillus sp. 179.-C4.2 HS]MDP5196496.1 YheC/YheD family protein [Neobacillus sp. 179.-C4.2 HS]
MKTRDVIYLQGIGMLHFRENPADVKKAYPFAAVAKMEGIHFFYFSFNNVDFDNMKIDGWMYEEGKWIQKQVDFPAVVINSCNPKTEIQTKILKNLKKYAILTSFPVGNKMKVYKKVKKAKVFASYLIPSTTLHKPEELISFLKNQPRAVIKPLSGNHGKKVFFIEKTEQQYKVTEEFNTMYMNEKELNRYFQPIITGQKFLMQPFIECKTKNGLTYDFRLHVQKNGEGKWEINLIYPRISGNAKMISNISSGGYRGELASFLKDEFGEESKKVKESLEVFALTFSAHFDTLYENSFDELGIDVGMDANQRLWMFEVNWRPGSKNREFEVAKRLIPYCKYLINKNWKTII